MTVEESNIIISKYMDVSDNFKSLDKLITVWQKLEKEHYPSGIMFEGIILNGVDCGFELSSSLVQSEGGFEVDTCMMDDSENGDRTIQECAIILTATVIEKYIPWKVKYLDKE